MKTPAFLLLLCLGPLTTASHGMPDDDAQPKDTAADPAEAGYLAAKASLYGTGVPRDQEKAFVLMHTAAEAGHADATGALGYFHLTGTGVPRDTGQALHWFRKGAELGSAKAQLNLARCLLGKQDTGAAIPGDDPEQIREGLAWLRKAAEQGLADAAANLGAYHYAGEFGLEKNMETARRWFLIAAEAGDATSQNYLGVIHDPGIPGGLSDVKVAERWYRKSAMQGNIKAQSNLGRLLDPFSSDPTQRIEAISWTIVAKENGEITAEKRFNEVVRPKLSSSDYEAALRRAGEIKTEISQTSGKTPEPGD